MKKAVINISIDLLNKFSIMVLPSFRYVTGYYTLHCRVLEKESYQYDAFLFSANTINDVFLQKLKYLWEDELITDDFYKESLAKMENSSNDIRYNRSKEIGTETINSSYILDISYSNVNKKFNLIINQFTHGKMFLATEKLFDKIEYLYAEIDNLIDDYEKAISKFTWLDEVKE